jgi:hypothetical protein
MCAKSWLILERTFNNLSKCLLENAYSGAVHSFEVFDVAPVHIEIEFIAKNEDSRKLAQMT